MNAVDEGASGHRGSGVLRLVEVMDELRSPGGCPWDAHQTHQSLVKYLVEETYEVVEAIEVGTAADLREELGDVLLQVVFHARIAEEADPPWNIDEVADGIVEKLVRRHPHVYGDEVPGSADELEQRWQESKVAEKKRTSVLDGIPQSLPALALADKLVSRARQVGVDEVAQVPLVLGVDGEPLVSLGLSGERACDESAIGEGLLAMVVASRQAGVDPEAALRRTLRKLQNRIRVAETEPPDLS